MSKFLYFTLFLSLLIFVACTSIATTGPVVAVTPVKTMTPTPDLRVYTLIPDEIVLKVDELPKEGKFFFPGDYWVEGRTDRDIYGLKNQAVADEYVKKTERISGSFMCYARGVPLSGLPDDVCNGVILFKTAQGSQLALEKYLDPVQYMLNEKWQEVNVELDLKNPFRVYQLIIPDGRGHENKFYKIIVAERNVIVTAEGFAYNPDNIQNDLFENILHTVIKRVTASPLSLGS